MPTKSTGSANTSKGYPRTARLRGKTFHLKHLVKMQDFGLCDDSRDTMRIWLRPDQPPQDFLETIIHECLHGCLPDTTEEAVIETAEDIARVLWRYGYRRS